MEMFFLNLQISEKFEIVIKIFKHNFLNFNSKNDEMMNIMKKYEILFVIFPV